MDPEAFIWMTPIDLRCAVALYIGWTDVSLKTRAGRKWPYGTKRGDRVCSIMPEYERDIGAILPEALVFAELHKATLLFTYDSQAPDRNSRVGVVINPLGETGQEVCGHRRDIASLVCKAILLTEGT